jgi:chitinase
MSKFIGGYYVYWSGYRYRLHELPKEYNQLYLFHATPTGNGNITNNTPGGTYYDDCRLALQQGRRLIISCGGANAGFTLDNRQQSDNFLRSFNGIISTIAGNTGINKFGIDWNNFEANVQPSTAEMIYVSQQLKATYGNDFVVTSPVAPWRQADKDWAVAMNRAGVLDYVSPQFYDGPGLNQTSAVLSQLSSWVGLIGANRMGVGLGINSSGYYWTAAEAGNCMRQVLAQWPEIRGVFTWEIIGDMNQGSPFTRTMAPIMGSVPVSTTPVAPVPTTPAQTTVSVDPDWTFYQGKDSWNGFSSDQQLAGKSVAELKAWCIANGASGFNTNGYIKTTLVKPFLSESTFSGSNQGLYVRNVLPVVPSVPTAPVVTPTPVPAVTAVPVNSETLIAPYICGWHLGNTSTYKIQSCMDYYNKLGGKVVTWAFVKGDTSVVNSQVIADFKAFQAVGGKVIVSFGGEGGPYLEESLGADAEFAAIDTLIQKTGVYGLDFDIEGERLPKSGLNDQRSKVIARIQQKYPSLYISFTLPSSTNGVIQDGVRLLQNAISNGVRVDMVNIMVMDYYDNNLGSRWGQTAVASGEGTVQTLRGLYPQKSTAELYKMLGLTAMIGKNDDNTVFSVADTITISNYAKDKNIGLISFWSIERDQTGTNGDLGTQSKVNTRDFEFHQAITSVLGVPSASVPSAPVTSPVSVPSVPSAPVVNISTNHAWTANSVYDIGNVVNYNGVTYRCIQHHSSIDSWNPIAAPSLWETISGSSPTPTVVPSVPVVAPTSTLSVAGKHSAVYYQTWSANWASSPANHDLTKIPSNINVVYLAFAQPDMVYTRGSNTFQGTGLQFSADFAVVKGAIAILRARGVVVMLSIGGATYAFNSVNASAIANLVTDLGLDGVDIDWEDYQGAVAKGKLGPIIQSVRSALPRPFKVCIAAFSVGAYGRDKWVNAMPASQNTGMCVDGIISNGADLDWINIMSYDASPAYDPLIAYDAYRSIYSGPLIIGVEVPPEAWGGNVVTVTQARKYYAKADGLFVWSYQKTGSPSCADLLSVTVPSVPVVPVTTPVPSVPSVPSVPVTTPVPSVPSVPVTTPVPSVPSVPVTTPVPSVPSVPVTTPVPSVPLVPVTTPVPSVPSVPVTTPVPSVPSVPVTTPVPSVPLVPVTTPVPSVPSVVTPDSVTNVSITGSDLSNLLVSATYNGAPISFKCAISNLVNKSSIPSVPDTAPVAVVAPVVAPVISLNVNGKTMDTIAGTANINGTTFTVSPGSFVPTSIKNLIVAGSNLNDIKVSFTYNNVGVSFVGRVVSPTNITNIKLGASDLRMVYVKFVYSDMPINVTVMQNSFSNISVTSVDDTHFVLGVTYAGFPVSIKCSMTDLKIQ